MNLKRTIAVAVTLGLALGVLARAGSPSRISICPSYAGIYQGESAKSQHEEEVNELLGNAWFWDLVKSNPKLAAALLSSASTGKSPFDSDSDSPFDSDSGSPYEPSETGEWSWFFTAREGYRVVESDVAVNTLGAEGHLRTWTTQAAVHMLGDRWRVSTQLSYRTWDGYGSYEGIGGKSLTLSVTPQYYLMQQDSEGINLSLLMTAGFERVWYDEDMPFDDADYVTYGVGALIGRTFAFGNLSLGYLYQPWINIDGDDELDGTNTMDYHNATLTYSFGITENLYAGLQAIWEYTEDLPDVYDSDQYLGRAMVGYGTECWGFQASYGRTLYSDDFGSWSTDLMLFCRF